MNNYGADFRRAKEEYYKTHKTCLGESLIPHVKCYGVMTIHHAKGRIGDLMTDQRYFRMLCAAHHKWVHRNHDKAVELGLSFPELLTNSKIN